MALKLIGYIYLSRLYIFFDVILKRYSANRVYFNHSFRSLTSYSIFLLSNRKNEKGLGI